MKEALEIFRFNDHVMSPMTMEKAIDLCRERALYDDEMTVLYVKKKNGNFLRLATYAPLPRQNWEKYYIDPHNPDDKRLVPQVDVELEYIPR